jgi:hypothetical protein
LDAQGFGGDVGQATAAGVGAALQDTLDSFTLDRAGGNRASIASPALLVAAGMFSPLLREMRETASQFRAPFVIDSSKFDAGFGRLEPTPHRDAVAQTIAWYRSR